MGDPDFMKSIEEARNMPESEWIKWNGSIDELLSKK